MIKQTAIPSDVGGCDGQTLTCTWIIHVVAQGLRIELCWDTTGTADIEPHLGKHYTTSDWFDSSGTDADCYYTNCTDDLWHDVSWGYPMVGGHNNPRLDIDNISVPGIPENINLDNPADGDGFRVLVHYYGTSTTTHPVVNIYCGGTRKVTYGISPQVLGFDTAGYNDGGDGWKVADIVWDGGFWSDSCNITPVLSGSSYWQESGPFNWGNPR